MAALSGHFLFPSFTKLQALFTINKDLRENLFQTLATMLHMHYRCIYYARIRTDL